VAPRRARRSLVQAPFLLALVLATAAADLAFAQAPAPAQPAPGGRKRRQPPPPVIPVAETATAQKQYDAGNYEGSVAQAKAALNKNEKYTPAMMVMAKAYFRLRKYEWVRTLWKMMQNANASDAEKAEMYQILAFMEIEKNQTPQAIELLKKAVEARPEHFKAWNNLGAQYLTAKNYREAAPALEKAVQLNPTFTKAYLNLGSAYRGLKEYEKAQSSYEKALQLYSNYADAVFHLGILYLDAEKMTNMDTIARLNQAITFFGRYKQMLGSAGQRPDPLADTYVAEAQEKITKEQKRIERQKKAEERERQRAAQKAAKDVAGAAKPPGTPGAPGAPAPAPGAPAAPPVAPAAK
jgi:tetratricopeptide (TPR) repeat protein